MNVIPRTFLANSIYQRCVNQYSRVAKEIKVTIPDTVPSRAFSCVTHIDNAKCYESVYLTQTKQISTTNTSNIVSDKLSGFSSGIIKKATFNSTDNSFCKVRIIHYHKTIEIFRRFTNSGFNTNLSNRF